MGSVVDTEAETPLARRFYTILEALERRCLFTVSISGVEPAALDQPRINAFVRLPGQAQPLSANLGFFGGFEDSFNIEAYYDTGASGVLLSNQTTTLLVDSYPELSIYSVAQNPSVPTEPNVVFTDVGVGGSQNFFVSVPLDIGLAPFNGSDASLDLDNAATYQQVYNQMFTPIRTQIGQPEEDENPLLSGLDVFGTPLMQNKVVVMDPSPVNTFLDTMRTFVYNPGTPYNPLQRATNPGIPQTDYHIALSYGDFERFTKVTPSGSAGPTLATNPFIGSNPVRALEGLPSDGTPPVTMQNNGNTIQRSFLLDTGAAASIISTSTAQGLGVRYRAGTFGTDSPQLETMSGGTVDNQFMLTIGGVGGTVTLAGFYMEKLSVPTVEGEMIEFPSAPVLVGDISALDDNGTQTTSDDQSITLDGIFGMNFLVASIFVSQTPGSIFPDLGAPVVGGFDWLVYDSVNHQLGLTLADTTPNPRVYEAEFDYNSGGEQALYIQFTKDVGDSLDDSDLILQNLTTGQTVPVSAIDHAWEPSLNTATFSFPGYALPGGYLPDGNYRVTMLADSVDDGEYTMLEDYHYEFFFLAGDFNRDRIVDTQDFNIISAHLGTPQDAVFGEGDINYDGQIDAADMTLFRSRYGLMVPAPPSLQIQSSVFDFDNGDQPKITIQFSEDVGATLDESDLVIDNLTDGLTLAPSDIAHSYNASTRTATFTFPDYALSPGFLPDGNYRAMIVAGTVEGTTLPLRNDFEMSFHSLAGDANRDRKVDTADFNLLAGGFGTLATGKFGKGDFNYDSNINSLDFAVFAGRYGKTLPAVAGQSLSRASVLSSDALSQVVPVSGVSGGLASAMRLSPGLSIAAPTLTAPALSPAQPLFSSSPIDDDVNLTALDI